MASHQYGFICEPVKNFYYKTTYCMYYTFSPVCIIMWFFNQERRSKYLPQFSHMNGFLRVCHSSCFFKELIWLKDLQQVSQLNGFTSVWNLICSRNVYFLGKDNTAFYTCIWHIPGMNLHVRLHSTFNRKNFTSFTFIWLFFSMPFHVFF